MTRDRWFCTVLLFLVLPFCAAAQTQGTLPPAEGTPKAPPGAATDPPKGHAAAVVDPCLKNPPARPTLTSILAGSGLEMGTVASHTGGSPGASVYLGQWLTLRGCGLKELADKATPEKPLQLYLNGMPLDGVTPVVLHKDGALSGVRFELVRTEESKGTWAALLGRPKTIETAVDVSLGPKGCREGCTDMTNPLQIHLVALRPGWATSYVFVLLLFLALLLWLAVTRGLLRDRGPGSPWSLARTQMAWWTFFVVGAFVLIWMVSGSYSSLSGSVLALIGISSGTALLGAVIDDTKENQKRQRDALALEKQGLQARSATLSAAEVQRLTEIDQQLRETPVMQEKKPKSFLFDILSDEDGMSFHRFQMAVWTVVLTAIFVVRVYSTLAMPDFDTQLLGLTGISAGTYLGFKLPEKMV